jgi:hypothetical protein
MLATAFLAAALASTAFASASPAVVERSLSDTDRCLDVRHLGIIDLNVSWFPGSTNLAKIASLGWFGPCSWPSEPAFQVE